MLVLKLQKDAVRDSRQALAEHLKNQPPGMEARRDEPVRKIKSAN
ncbi:hypothetical protein NCHU2750_12720 [Neorhizobium sp. NCHU2750]|nr:hypothetical protein NCHU2750_12720 [Neorhizobium sp. NCHU2750]